MHSILDHKFWTQLVKCNGRLLKVTDTKLD